jgi:hypothetical protein
LNDFPKSGRPGVTSERSENIAYQKSMDDVRKNAADITRELASKGVLEIIFGALKIVIKFFLQSLLNKPT